MPRVEDIAELINFLTFLTTLEESAVPWTADSTIKITMLMYLWLIDALKDSAAKINSVYQVWSLL